VASLISVGGLRPQFCAKVLCTVEAAGWRTVAVVAKHSNAPVERCAGGAVTRVVGDELMVAVVHRPRFDDWVLPKGHLDSGETWEQAGLREVAEETGLDAAIVGPPAVIGYMLPSGVPKIVLFFPMEPSVGSDIGTGDPHEVDAVEWWPAERALAQLTYDDERLALGELLSAGGASRR
jgi:8-oxo-dGTP pyrophosphatase MutT (NUDIX family)